MKQATRIFRISIAVTVAIVAFVTVAFYISRGSDCVSRESFVYLPTGSDYSTLLDSLGRNGVKIRNKSRFVQYALLERLSDNIHPGRYQLKPGMSYHEVISMFKRGQQSPVRVTFNNIRTLPQLAGAISRQLEPDSATLTGVLTADSTAKAYGLTPATMISMFIPNTYEFYWNTTPKGFLDRMNKEYGKFWTPEREAKLKETGLTREQAVTLASIVYEETKMSDEMPTVAGVYVNRIKKGMPLQADPTVKFAVGDFTLRRILHRHLEVDSPYNTYKYAGLPPGPISMPSIKAVDAVLNYKHHDYLYFCARPDFSGYHNFARTLAEHNRNAQAYTSALNKMKIYK